MNRFSVKCVNTVQPVLSEHPRVNQKVLVKHRCLLDTGEINIGEI